MYDVGGGRRNGRIPHNSRQNPLDAGSGSVCERTAEASETAEEEEAVTEAAEEEITEAAEEEAVTEAVTE